MRELYDEAAHARLAFEAAVQGSVLLRNDDVLPLAAKSRLALLGPMKDVNWELLGSYSGYKDAANWSDSPNVVTIKQGLTNCGTWASARKTNNSIQNLKQYGTIV